MRAENCHRRIGYYQRRAFGHSALCRQRPCKEQSISDYARQRPQTEVHGGHARDAAAGCFLGYPFNNGVRYR